MVIEWEEQGRLLVYFGNGMLYENSCTDVSKDFVTHTYLCIFIESRYLKIAFWNLGKGNIK